MSQDFEIPPMGADNLPLKEMKTETPVVAQTQTVQTAAPKKNSKTILIIIFVVLFALIIGLMLGASLKPGTKVSTIKPSASPTAESSPENVQASKEPQNTKERLDNLSGKISETDFKEQSLQPPIVDFNIRFEINQ